MRERGGIMEQRGDNLRRSHATVKYRADIDGLRAVAVLAVVLYHAGLVWFRGGFVGVDVFFVISGFLITRIIVEDVDAHRFSVVQFYERRVRRLFPALFTMFAAVAAVGFWLLMPNDLRKLSQSLVAATLFASNALFSREAGYFDAPALSKPLLHTWSLAVEEQFYIFFPLLLAVILRTSRRTTIAILAVLGLASFLGCVWTVGRYPDAAFYLAPFRAWELLLGAVLALGALRPIERAWLRQLAAAVGLALILVAVIAFSSRTLFPGFSALAPCIGAALIVHAGSGGGSAVQRLLSLPAVVFVGLISYPLYLWHWPILVFAEYLLVRPPTTLELAGLIAAAVTVATLSWRLIERPFRARRVAVAGPTLFRFAAVAMAASVGIGLVGHAFGGFPGRIPLESRKYAAAAADSHAACYRHALRDVTAERLCHMGAPSSNRGGILVWGDSHAAALAPGVSAAASAAGKHGWIAVQSGCPPLLGVTRAGAPPDYNCPAFNERVMEFVVGQRISTVILAARWSLNLSPRPLWEHRQGAQVLIVDAESPEPSAAENRAVFFRGLSRTLSRLASIGATAWVVEEVPYVGHDTPSALARLSRHGRLLDVIAPDLRSHESRIQPVRDAFDRLKRRHEFNIVDVAKVLCVDRKRCLVAHDGSSLYSDDDHLSRYGAEFVQSAFREPIAGLVAARPLATMQ